MSNAYGVATGDFLISLSFGMAPDIIRELPLQIEGFMFEVAAKNSLMTDGSKNAPLLPRRAGIPIKVQISSGRRVVCIFFSESYCLTYALHVQVSLS